MELLLGYSIVELFIAPLNLIAGFCEFVAGFLLDIKEGLRSLNVDIRISRHRKITAEEHIRMKKKLNDIIRFHSETIE